MTQHLLFELGCEELPPKTLLKLSNALSDGIVAGLNEAELAFSNVKNYAAPRRLAILIENLQAVQSDKTVQKRGVSIQAAFQADGTPSKAALAFAQSCGVEFDQLERLKTDKGEWLACTQTIEGQTTQQLIPDIIRKSLANLPIAKRMRWGNSAVEFVRPVHWAVLLYGEEIIETEILGLQTGNQTRGHRFHAPQAITIAKPENYADILFSQGKVIADFEQRKNQIRTDAEKAASAVNGIAHIEEDLLEEIAALNEFPVPITGHFDERFLALPAEVLITTMQENQKYFPVKNPPQSPFNKGEGEAQGDLRPYFITFSNIESTNQESIKHGNERVVTPRLSDAEFFWKQDRRYSLADFAPRLETIVFQEKLGTVAAKVQRLMKLAEYVAPIVNADVELAKRAAFLAKNDLMTEMVGEFGNLQGTMGRYYALADGENSTVAQAIEEHYLPKQAGGATPTSDIGCVVALAEKIDTLAGIFSTGLIPTGDKDPYALRRAALGVLRILIEHKLQLDIYALTNFALSLFNHEFDKTKTQTLVTDFIFERLKGYCLDKGFTADEFEAVLVVNPGEPLDFMQRLQAVKAFRHKSEAESLIAANKRILNILKKSDSPAETVGNLVEMVEIELHELAKKSAADIQPLLEKRDYQATLNRLAELKQPVDAFFDGVMVNCEDLELRANRLALLNLLSQQFLTCADISKLQA